MNCHSRAQYGPAWTDIDRDGPPELLPEHITGQLICVGGGL